MLLELAPDSTVQRSLLRPETRFAEKARLQSAIDHLNREFGRDAIRTARLGFAKQHRLRAEMKSRWFTTRRDEVLRVW